MKSAVKGGAMIKR